MNTVFWSPSKDGQTTRNMYILANTLKLRYGVEVCIFGNDRQFYEDGGKQTEKMVFVDCQNHRGAYVSSLLKTADTVIVNFPGDPDVLADYFSGHHEILGNIFYLISSSLRDTLNMEVLSEQIFRLKKEEMGVLPYSVHFEEQYAAKKAYSYQYRLFQKEPGGMDGEFARKTSEIAGKFLKMNCLFTADTLY